MSKQWIDLHERLEAVMVLLRFTFSGMLHHGDQYRVNTVPYSVRHESSKLLQSVWTVKTHFIDISSGLITQIACPEIHMTEVSKIARKLHYHPQTQLIYGNIWRSNFKIVWPCIMMDSLWIKPTDALSSNFIGITTLHRQEFLAVHRIWYILCSCDDQELLVANGHHDCIKCTKADVRLRTPDDGQKGCPKHVEL